MPTHEKSNQKKGKSIQREKASSKKGGFIHPPTHIQLLRYFITKFQY